MLPESFDFVNHFRKYDGNPILRPGSTKETADCVFNPGAILHNGEVRMLCRCINFDTPKSGDNWSVSTLVWAKSRDGLSFELDDKPFLAPWTFYPGLDASRYPGGFEDPRLVFIPEEGLYVLTFTGVESIHRTPGMSAISADLEHWEFLGENFPARAVSLTDRRINGKYWAYYGNSGICLAWSEDLRVWETDKSPVMRPRAGFFDETLCEAVCAPIINDDGILLLYNGAAPGHYKKRISNGVYRFREGVDDHCYSIGWALFDRNDPTRLIARCDDSFLKPELPYELYGIAEYTAFGEGLVRLDGKYILYYGCSDTRIAAAIAEV